MQLGGDRRPQRQLVRHVAGRETRRARRHDESDDPFFGPGPHDRDVGDRTVGDPHLRAVEDPVGAVAPCGGAHARRVGPEVRLGQPEASDDVTGGHRGQPLVALFLTAPAVDREHRQRPLHRHEAAQTAVDRLEFLAHQPVGDGRRAAAAVALQMHAQQAELAQVGCQLANRHLTGFEPVGDMRPQPLLAESVHRLAQFDVFG